MYTEDKAVAGNVNIKERDYWLNKLSGDLEKTHFFYDYQRNYSKKTQLDTINFRFSENHFIRLMELSKGSDYTLHIILLACLVVLLYKYTGVDDVIVGSPIYRQDIDGEFINTVLVLRNSLDGKKTFKEILLEMKETAMAAVKHQNYPVEALLYLLGMDTEGDDFPLFDIVMMLENIHDRAYIQHINPNMVFSFLRTHESIECVIQYSTALYKPETIKRIINHFMKVFNEVQFEPDTCVSEISLLSEQERNQVLFEFNSAKTHLVRDKCYHQLFEHQVERNPDGTAAVCSRQHITYKELNEVTNRIARFLSGHDTGSNFVGVYMKRSLEMLAAIIGIFKAGGAYLPIEIDYPETRVKYMLENGEVTNLITSRDNARTADRLQEALPLLTGVLYTDDIRKIGNSLYELPAGNPGMNYSSKNLAYMIYTSGTTGKPKGVMIHQLGMLNHLYAKINDLSITETDTIAQTASACFDISIWQFLTALIIGGKTVIIDKEIYLDPWEFIKVLKNERITILESVPSLINTFLTAVKHKTNKNRELRDLRWMIPTGEPLLPHLVRKWYHYYPHIKLMNAYGPTEASDDVTHYAVKDLPPADQSTIPIGKPVQNLHVYILDKHLKLCPVGVRGEICVAGIGVGKGYWQDDEKTNRSFIPNPFWQEIGDNDYARLYRTGDIGYFRPDGFIECLGRLDYQVKIRGNRIELGEIERQLLEHNEIKEAVVISRSSDRGSNYLCAYIVGAATLEKRPVSAELKEYLSKKLPAYMIPSYFILLEKIPLSPGGKTDRKALPEPGIDADGAGEFIPPADKTEKKLALLWSKVLSIEESDISTNLNFFHAGGHSLSATILSVNIHKELDVKVPLAEIFRNPTIKELAAYIKQNTESQFISIEPGEEKEFYALSSAQERLYIIQQMDPDSTAYNLPIFLRLGENYLKDKLENTFNQMIERHESLRTSFHIIGGEPVQRIHNAVEFEIEYYDMKEVKVEEERPSDLEGTRGAALISSLVRPFDLSRAPLLRVGLVNLLHTPTALRGHPSQEGKKDEYLLMLDMHHIICDGISHDILARDFLTHYGGEKLPHLRLRYRDYSQWQNQVVKGDLKEQEAFWIKEFENQIPVLELPTDYPRPGVKGFEGRDIFFEIKEENTKRLNQLALKEGATLYMTLLAIFNIFLSRLSGGEDIVVGTAGAGRGHADLEQIIGMFVNTLPLRNYPNGEKTFRQFLQQVKERTLNAFDNQDYQLESLVDNLSIKRDTSRNPLFEVTFGIQNMENAADKPPAEENPDLQLTPYEYENQVTKFDLTLAMEEIEGKLSSVFVYSTRLFKSQTILRFTRYFNRVVAAVLKDPEIKLARIELLPGEEREQLLVNFNRSYAWHPREKTIPQLFEEHVNKTPDNPAVINGDNRTTYRELNEKANGLARVLAANGAGAETIVAIMMEKSIDLIVGILAVLKSGSAYLPLDPEYPAQRLSYMIKDSGVSLLLTTNAAGNHISPKDIGAPGLRYLYPDGVEGMLAQEDRQNLQDRCTPANSAYVIYTSGSTGLPKGVLVEHRNVVNLATWQAAAFHINHESRVLQFFSYSFDGAVGETFMALLNGAALVMINLKDTAPGELMKAINFYKINLGVFVPSMLRQLNPGQLALPGKLIVVSVGEACTRELLNKWADKCIFVNGYGPTETTVYSHIWEASPGNIDLYHDSVIPIGKPIHNYKSYILDAYLNPVPVGVTGELYISGAGVARGYLNRPEVTAERFIPGRVFPLHQLEYQTNDLLLIKSAQEKIEQFKQEHSSKVYQRSDINARTQGKVSSSEIMALARDLDADIIAKTRDYIRRYYEEPILYNGFCRYIYEGAANTYSSAGINNEILGHLLNYQEFRGLKGVDFGFGNGEVLQDLIDAGACMKGFDISPFFVQRARNKKLDVRMLKIDTDTRDFEEECGIDRETQDFVISTLVMDRVENPKNLLRNMFRVLKPGGRFALQTLLPIVPLDDGDVEMPVVYTSPGNRLTTGASVEDDKHQLLTVLYRLGARGIKIQPLPFVVKSNDGVQEYKAWSFSGVKAVDSESSALPGDQRNSYLRMYKTGDLTRFLEDGNIEFLGRIDQQIKVRGFRVELGEIENQLLKHEAIKEVVVLATDCVNSNTNQEEIANRQNKNTEKILCAYIVPAGELPVPDPREYLSDKLPYYMVPTYFAFMDSIPLTPNGKINRKALPKPETPGSSRNYSAPVGMEEIKLVDIWSEILGIEKQNIGIDDNFFDLGGHSLKATILTSHINKIFEVNLVLGEIFKTPFIRGLSRIIKHTVKNSNEGLRAVEKKEYYVLSSSQQRMFVAQRLIPDSLSYNMPIVVRVEGKLHKEKLEAAFKNLVNRHESFRSSFFESTGKEPAQKIHDRLDFNLEYYDFSPGIHNSSGNSETGVIKNFIRPFSLHRAPLLRAGLVKLGKNVHVLITDMHHIISDGVSVGILINELMRLYNGEVLPKLPLQYKDFSQWQTHLMESGGLRQQEEYWLNRFNDAIPLLVIPVDYPRPPVRNIDSGDSLIFRVDKQLTGRLYQVVKKTGTTLFILLLAAYNLLLSKFSGQEDIVVGTIATGRTQSELHNAIGVFLNMLPLRNQPKRNKTFSQFLREVKENALKAYENQDYPYDQLVMKLGVQREANRNPLFDTVFNMNNFDISAVPCPGLTLKPYKEQINFAKFDLYIQATETNGAIDILLRYSTEIFMRSTAEKIKKYFIEILRQTADDLGVKLQDITLSYDFVVTESNVLEDDGKDFDLLFNEETLPNKEETHEQ